MLNNPDVLANQAEVVPDGARKPLRETVRDPQQRIAITNSPGGAEQLYKLDILAQAVAGVSPEATLASLPPVKAPPKKKESVFTK
jgi:hypothetical protein